MLNDAGRVPSQLCVNLCASITKNTDRPKAAPTCQEEKYGALRLENLNLHNKRTETGDNT